jgi:hypothetical protein
MTKLQYEVPLSSKSELVLKIKSVIPEAKYCQYWNTISIHRTNYVKGLFGIMWDKSYDEVIANCSERSGIWKVYDEEVGIKLQSVGLKCELELKL